MIDVYRIVQIRSGISLLLFFLCSIATASEAHTSTGTFQDSIVIKKHLNNKNQKASIYPDETNENLFFTSTGTQPKGYQFFLFDMDGKLVKQTVIPVKQTELLIRVEKGNYLFELFSEDERIENGSIVIK